ncbi:MAG: FecR family protein [Agriterribacter sp.]
MHDARTLVLLGKKLNNEATEEELIELAQLLQAASIKPHSLELLREIWLKKQKGNESLLDEKWDSLLLKIAGPEEQLPIAVPVFEQQKRKFTIARMAVAAAVSIAVVLTIYFSFQKSTSPQKVMAAYETPDSIVTVLNGEKKRIVLPDSTKVYLNSGSRLVYSKRFGSGSREVQLTGEAFFEVTKDAAHPFIVNTSRMFVKVLGTVFNVKAYETPEDIETTVVEGKVEVSLKEDREKKVVLLPSEKISLKNNSFYQSGKQAPLKYEVETVKPKETNEHDLVETAWVNDKVVFHEESFEMVALKMERWYNVRVHFYSEKTKHILMSGDFDNVAIDEALQILQMLVHFTYEKEGDDIYIR